MYMNQLRTTSSTKRHSRSRGNRVAHAATETENCRTALPARVVAVLQGSVVGVVRRQRPQKADETVGDAEDAQRAGDDQQDEEQGHHEEIVAWPMTRMNSRLPGVPLAAQQQIAIPTPLALGPLKLLELVALEIERAAVFVHRTQRVLRCAVGHVRGNVQRNGYLRTH